MPPTQDLHIYTHTHTHTRTPPPSPPPSIGIGIICLFECLDNCVCCILTSPATDRKSTPRLIQYGTEHQKHKTNESKSNKSTVSRSRPQETLCVCPSLSFSPPPPTPLPRSYLDGKESCMCDVCVGVHAVMCATLVPVCVCVHACVRAYRHV